MACRATGASCRAKEERPPSVCTYARCVSASGQPPSEYPAVKDSHVTPRLYLKAWTDDANLAEVHAVKLPAGAPPGIKLKPRRIGVKGIAVRDCFYARERPSGELFHDVEWSLGQAEDAVAPLLNELRARWPLAEEDKAAIAEFLALQTVRVPKEFERLNQVSEAAVVEFVARTDHPPGPGVVEGRLTEESIAAHYKFVRNKTRQMKRMLRHERIGAAMLGSMQWTLVEFDEPLLVTSDHPVHLWPLGKSVLRPRASETPGVRDTLEVKWPISLTSRYLPRGGTSAMPASR